MAHVLLTTANGAQLLVNTDTVLYFQKTSSSGTAIRFGNNSGTNEYVTETPKQIQTLINEQKRM